MIFSEGRELTDKADYLYFDKADETSAFSVYQQAAQQGSNSAMASLAKMWAMGRSTGVGKNMQKAHYWRDKAFISINQLATNGHAFSQYQLGTLYNTVDKNELFAVEWYRKAADQGNAYAQSNLAYMIMHGKGIRQSDREAERWYRKAAEQGVARAQFNLGYIYVSVDSSHLDKLRHLL
ncbi:tetratricopeptide repeat protein [Bathymodiolus platifrons methanotrophic gill symbiont]|uniref:tetratricopeptide repeat protein n=1 Tax=Bathymodiolus platifrons methanotrophic gill symbiont TaxID=113268 RepID=UPI001C8CF780|nr:tetratricopeptide repeat protein [Bathymodiolus platifrons methanotrophic gill symbiont]